MKGDNPETPPRGGADRQRRLRPFAYVGDEESLLYVTCRCGSRIKEPFHVAEATYTVAWVHRRSRGKNCRVTVTIHPTGDHAVKEVPDSMTFEDALREEAA